MGLGFMGFRDLILGIANWNTHFGNCLNMFIASPLLGGSGVLTTGFITGWLRLSNGVWGE